MKLFFRPALALLLGAALATSLTACDYRWSPGKNPQFHNDFTNAPGWHNEDVNRDSINYKQRVTKPSGVGSATAIKNGSVQDQLDSAPSGNSGAAGQTASGQPNAVDQNTTTPATGTTSADEAKK
jgi:hypothetical protein